MIRHLAKLDCIKGMRMLDDEMVDSIVTDPPYELGFMGKEWDRSGVAYDLEIWKECLRILKPGGQLLAFGSPRTYHRMTCSIEDAGFEIRDSIHWFYGTGMPKSMNVGKAIDRKLGAEREVVGQGKGRTGEKAQPHGGSIHSDDNYQWPGNYDVTTAASDEAQRWDGWGTGLKPAHEPIVLARKSFKGTVALNVLKHGTGAINVDGCRVEAGLRPLRISENHGLNRNTYVGGAATQGGSRAIGETTTGRWPPNLAFSHHPECKQIGIKEIIGTHKNRPKNSNALTCIEDNADARNVYGEYTGKREVPDHTNPDGTETVAEFECVVGCPVKELGEQNARFFPCFKYQAKASRKERNEGLSDGEVNKHPTVKPLELMKWLVRLITPPDGLVVDPFAGSGTTLIAAQMEGMYWIGFETDADSVKTARQRLAHFSQ